MRNRLLGNLVACLKSATAALEGAGSGPSSGAVLKGHGFSRANRLPGKREALAPEARLLHVFLLLLLCVPSVQAQYQLALPGYRFEFPRDHFSHPEYQTEWWYYTGNLQATDGHRFGFELTFFRQGVSRQPAATDWTVRDLYMAHLALSDLSGGRYYHQERINRAG